MKLNLKCAGCGTATDRVKHKDFQWDFVYCAACSEALVNAWSFRPIAKTPGIGENYQSAITLGDMNDSES